MNQSTNYFGQHLFSQIIFLYNRSIIQSVITKTNANRYYKRLHFYEHFISMLYCVLSGCTSLREIISGLGIAEGKLNHLDIDYDLLAVPLAMATSNAAPTLSRRCTSICTKNTSCSLSDSTLPKGILGKLFLLDATVFGLFKAILKTSGRYALPTAKRKAVSRKKR